jgi:VWFA-related protein
MTITFVLDTSGSMAGRKIRGCEQLIHAFLGERRREDQICLWTFGDERVIERFPFGMGWYLLPRVLETIRPWSTTALYDMVQRVPDVMERASHPRRAAIFLTDGVDNASEIRYQEATALVQQMQTPIYVLGIEPPPKKDGSGPSYEEILQLIADSSGGHYQRIPSSGDMPKVARALLEELSSRYILSFATSGVGKQQWRSIEVKVEGYQATARKGYMGTLP